MRGFVHERSLALSLLISLALTLANLLLRLSPPEFPLSSEPQPKNPSAEELQKLSSELSGLSRQHAKALEDDVFLGLRKVRIAVSSAGESAFSELCEIVGKAKLK